MAPEKVKIMQILTKTAAWFQCSTVYAQKKKDLKLQANQITQR